MGELNVRNARGVEATMLGLHEDCMGHIHSACERHSPRLQELLHLEGDVATWLGLLAQQPEAQQLNSAHQDFGFAFYSAMSGLYRQSFASLRSFLEVTIGATYLSSLEFKRRQWVSGKLDISWSAMTSPEDGLYSSAFLNEFCPEAVPERAEALANLKKPYRRCSEYIHGNVATSLMLPSRIDYEDSVVLEWLETAKGILLAVLHAFTVRYYKDLSEDQRGKAESCIEEQFAHLRFARQLLGLPIEGEK